MTFPTFSEFPPIPNRSAPEADFDAKMYALFQHFATTHRDEFIAFVTFLQTNSLVIGGALNATAIGLTTPAAGKFTTLDVLGGVSFYGATGEAVKLYWDAIAERLGIGTATPEDPLHLHKEIGGVGLRLSSGDDSCWISSFAGSNTVPDGFYWGNSVDGEYLEWDIDRANGVSRIYGTGFYKQQIGGSAAGVGLETELINQGSVVLTVDRRTDDGALVNFEQNGTVEGSISVSGTTVSYNGGHLSRWSQVDGIILRGTVMTNLDDMCEWRGIRFTVPVLGRPAKGDAPAEYIDEEVIAEYFGPEPDGASVEVTHVDGQVYDGTVFTEKNEQLNKVAVSSVAGDRNVAGVFQGWDREDRYGDAQIAMTGDFVIRIGAGVAVARGDLLESAGDGTARPQADDVIRSSTVAKVISAHVTEAYPDGSFLVPCVLMAC